MNKPNSFKDITGKKFNRLTVLSRSHKGKYGWYWKCRCDCGSIKDVLSSKLSSGHTKSCGCYKSENIRPKYSNKHWCWRGCGKLSGSIWCRIKANAKKRNKEFLITQEEAWKLYEKQNGLCALTGLPIVFAETSKDLTAGLNTASLDRIDSGKGYTLDNVQWVHVKINYMKQEFLQDEFIGLCELVAQYKSNASYR